MAKEVAPDVKSLKVVIVSVSHGSSKDVELVNTVLVAKSRTVKMLVTLLMEEWLKKCNATRLQ